MALVLADDQGWRGAGYNGHPHHLTRPEETAMAPIARDAGYRNGHFGKWQVCASKAGSPANPLRMGFEEDFARDNFFQLDPPLSGHGDDPEGVPGDSSRVSVNAPLPSS